MYIGEIKDRTSPSDIIIWGLNHNCHDFYLKKTGNAVTLHSIDSNPFISKGVCNLPLDRRMYPKLFR